VLLEGKSFSFSKVLEYLQWAIKISFYAIIKDPKVKAKLEGNLK
jgi:hypothetical protein